MGALNAASPLARCGPRGGGPEGPCHQRRDKAAALGSCKKRMTRHGRPEEVVTDELRSYGAAFKGIGGRTGGSRTAGSATAPKPPISRSDDRRRQCVSSDAFTQPRKSPQRTPRSQRLHLGPKPHVYQIYKDARRRSHCVAAALRGLNPRVPAGHRTDSHPSASTSTLVREDLGASERMNSYFVGCS